jgi:hypothetical protein
MKIKELGDSIMNFDLSNLEQPIKVVIYTYAGVLVVTIIAVILCIIFFIRSLK